MKLFDSIKTRFTFGIVLLIFAVAIVFSAISYRYEKKAVETRTYAQLSATADLKKQLIVYYLNERTNDLKTLASSEDLIQSILVLLGRNKDRLKNEHFLRVHRHLKPFIKMFPDYLGLEVLDLQGNLVVSAEAGHPSHIPVWNHRTAATEYKYISALKNGSVLILQDFLDQQEKHLDFIVGVMDKGEVRGIIISSIGLQNTLFPLFNDYAGLGHTGETLLVRRQGSEMVFVNDTRHPVSAGMTGADVVPKHNLGRTAAMGNEGIGETIDYRGKNAIGAYRYIPALKWGLVVKIDADEAFGEIYALRRRIVIFSLLILLIVLPVAYLIVRKFTGPIWMITQRTGAVAAGDYSVRIESRRKDEIGSLERNFNVMVKALSGSRKEIEEKQSELAKANIELERRVADRTADLSTANIALREGELRFRQLVENATDAIFLHDVEGGIIDVNRQACVDLGYSYGELLRMKVADFAPGFNPKNLPQIRDNVIAKGATTIVGIHQRKDGSSFPVEIRIGIFEYQGRRLFITLVRDITERKHAEDERLKLEEQLRQAQKMEAVGQLAGGVAHDFNNILSAIIGYAHLTIMKMNEHDPLKANLERIMESSQRAATLTQSLLAFSRQQVIKTEMIDLNELLKRFEKFLLRLLREDIELTSIVKDAPLTVMADSGQIEQVLMNLITNARDAMPHGGRLVITTDHVELDDEFVTAHGCGIPGAYALMSVQDTGAGMDEKTRERIFEPFFTTKEQGKGTGLGLSMVYGIVKQHNGLITVYSEKDKGTIFRIYLPIIKPHQESVEEEKQAITLVQRGTETVLLAEDDASLRKLSATVLTHFGYTVIEAVDGEDAVNKYSVNKDSIHLVILDAIMPKKNGKEAYDAIKQLQPDSKVIFVSGYTADIFDKRGIPDKKLNFLSKPFAPLDLAKKVREVLDS